MNRNKQQYRGIKLQKLFSAQRPFATLITKFPALRPAVTIGVIAFTSIALHAGTFDASAELPRVYLHTTIANTPATGSVLNVPARGDLQAALNQAKCGDTIRLQAGATYTSVYTFPAKACDDSHWIIVRTSAPDSSLPPEGTRLTPCYAGVSSLPGRPPFNCTSTHNVMAKLVMGVISGSGPIVFASGANHYRLIGLEVTRPAGGMVVYNLVSVPNGGTADRIIFDRMWMHGTASDDTTRGVLLLGMSTVGIVDSSFTDFHCTALTGACTDAQAILGGIGTVPGTLYKIVNNFLEASGENILFGGGRALSTPADIEIRHNHMFKPLIWMKGQPGFVGGKGRNPFIVKNLFELKNAQRVLLEANILENTWGGFSQKGFGVVLTPTNQYSSQMHTNVCPLCQVTDITIRYSTISHVASGFEISNTITQNGVPLAGGRYSIHDVVVDDINPTKYTGLGIFAQVSSGAGAPLLNNVTINHVTAFPTQIMLLVGNPANAPKIPHFLVTNSLLNATSHPIWSISASNDCASHDVPLSTLNSCFSPYFFSANSLVGVSTNYPSSAWPLGNYFPSSIAAVGFMNYNNGNGGNYQLKSSSLYSGKGTDGKDLGADIVAIKQAIASVY